MTSAQKTWCDNWCRIHASTWQVLRRSQWKYQFHEKTLVRFVEEASMREEEVELLLEYLTSDDCIATLALYDQHVSSEWTPYQAWYEISNSGIGKLHGVRLYHGMNTDVSAAGDGPYLTENGCAYKVQMTYYWKQSSVIDVPQSTSGEMYRITNLSRNDETGLYSYVLEHRTRVMQNIPEYLTRRTIYEDKEEASYYGVKQEDIATTGRRASVGDGVIVEEKRSKNEDCTTNISNDITTEKPVEEASVEYHKTLRGVRVTVTDQNQSVPVDDTDMEIGETRAFKKTPGGLYDNTVSKMTPEAAGTVASECRHTVFMHSDSEDVNVTSSEIPDEANEAGGGKTHAKSVRRNEDGTFDVTTRVNEEQTVPMASVAVAKTITGTTRTIVNRSMPEMADMTGLEVGESVENSETEGGRWNQQIRTVDRSARTHISDQCQATVYRHDDGTVDVVGANPGFDHVVAAGGGIIHEKSVSLTSDGSYRVEQGTKTELPVTNSTVAVQRNLHGTIQTIECSNQPQPLPTDALEVGDVVSNTVTPGGRFNTRITTRTIIPSGEIHKACTENRYVHTDSKTENEAENNSRHVGFEPGKIEQDNVRRNEDGTYDHSTTVSTAKPYAQMYQWTDDRGTHHVYRYRNQPKEYDGIPVTADTSSLSDSVNDFGLHDGIATWSYIKNGRGSPWQQRQGIFHGPKVSLYETRLNFIRRKWMHREWAIQKVIHYNDAWTDYLQDLLRASAAGSINAIGNNAILGVKLMNGPSKDDFGNPICTWVSIELFDRTNWIYCSGDCMHTHDRLGPHASFTFFIQSTVADMLR